MKLQKASDEKDLIKKKMPFTEKKNKKKKNQSELVLTSLTDQKIKTSSTLDPLTMSHHNKNKANISSTLTAKNLNKTAIASKMQP